MYNMITNKLISLRVEYSKNFNSQKWTSEHLKTNCLFFKVKIEM